MPKIIATLRTRSKVGAQTLESRIERTARESVVGEFVADTVRVVVTMQPDGAARVETFRLAVGASPSDTDPIKWIDNTSLVVPAEHARATTVETTPNTEVFAAEPFPF